MNKHLRFALRSGLFVFSVLLALALFEGLLRLLVPPSSGDVFLFTPYSKRFKVMKPNYRAMVYGVPFQTNELGFRDQREGRPDIRPGQMRIVVLGDSYTASAGVPFASVYTQVAERDLHDLPGLRAPKVLNLATPGYNVLQMYYTLTESGWSLSPDYVVVAILVSRDFHRMDLYGESRSIAMGSAASVPDWLDRLYVMRAFGAYIYRTYDRVVNALWINRTTLAASAGPDDLRINGQALLKIQSALAKRHIPLLVVLLPECSTFAKQQIANQQAGAFCTLHHIDFLDTLPAFVANGHGARSFRLNIIDRHPNVRYNQLVGDDLANALAPRLQVLDKTLHHR